MYKKYLIGSSLIGLKNNRDVDYLILVDDIPKDPIREPGVDNHYWTKEQLIDFLNFKTDVKQPARQCLWNYQCDRDLIGDDFPIEFHILDHKEKLKDFLKKVVYHRQLNFNKYVTFDGGYCSKLIYHFAYNLFILQNNSVHMTQEQKEIIQKIHDYQMPIEYLDELERMLNELD